MKYALHLQSRSIQVAADLERAVNAPGDDLAPAALAIARIEYPSLDSGGYIDALERMGDEAAGRVSRAGARGQDAIRVLNEYLYDDQRFTGNRDQYDDPRNSFLNEVLDRRTGIPITLAVVYLEVARRAGVQVTGVNFPGHFLLRAPDEHARLHYSGDFVIVDPFHGGALLSRDRLPRDAAAARRRGSRVRQRSAPAGDPPRDRRADAGQPETALRQDALVPAGALRGRPAARRVDPSSVSELRDRGLLAYHLQDFGAALRDLESYLRLIPRQVDEPEPSSLAGDGDDLSSDEDGDDVDDESTQVWEHIKNLRKRVASFN